MIKYINVSIIAFTTLFLMGCETSSAIKSAAADGMTNMFSCDKIENTFDAYDRDKNSFSALTQVTDMIGIDSSSFDTSAAASYYDMAKSGVNTALMLKGCSVK